MNPIGIVFSAEFLRRITSRAYRIATLLGALSIVLIAVLPKLFSGGFGGGSTTLVLVGDPALTAAARPLLAHDYTIGATLTRLDRTPDTAFLDAHGKATAVAVLSRRRGGLSVVAYARDPSAFRGGFARSLVPLQVALGTGVPVAAVQHHSTVPVEVHDVAGRFADASAAEAAKGIGYLFVFLLYLSILLNAQAIMASVAEEKTSRIAELLVATIDPAQLLTAKILAAAATGMIQLGVWIATGAFAGSAVVGMFSDGAPATGGMGIGPLALPPGEVLSFVAFFIVGFLQYGVLYAAAASLINRTEDLGSVTGPLVVPVVIGFMMAQLTLQFPSAPQLIVASQVPLLAPFVMFTRIAVSSVPAWQIVLSLAINVAAAALLALAAGKIYRVGLLLYGRPPSLKQVVATLRA
jgi:ABC-2 type transport system permease protein